MGYIWKLGYNPCDECLGLSAKTHESKPTRPHPFCHCTFIKLGEGGGQQCKHSVIFITTVTFVGVNTDYVLQGEPVTPENKLLQFYEVSGKCPDGTEMTVEVAIEITGDDLVHHITEWEKELDNGGSGTRSMEVFQSYAVNRAISQARGYFQSQCPDCP